MVTFIYAPTSDALGRKQLYSTITYLGDTVTTADGKSKKVTSSLVERYVNQFGSSGEAVSSFEYSYDDWNNIVKITDTVAEANDKTESVRTYEYDSVWKDKLVSYDGKRSNNNLQLSQRFIDIRENRR